MAKLVVKCQDKVLATLETSLELHVTDKEFWALLINQPFTIEGDYPQEVAHILAALRVKVDATGQIPKLQQLSSV